jgi:orotate phosphoribosyltransferase-like protein
MARPKIEITEELCKKAEALSAQGLTMEQIATVLGMSASSLYEKQK